MPSANSAKHRRLLSSQHPVITIKHGKDPEVQAVDIATRISHDALFIKSQEESLLDNNREIKKKTRSMTTKSTMTNEDDYTVVHTNTPCTSPTPSLLGNEVALDETQDDIEVCHKIVGWKMTPRVHFPPPNTLNLSSLPTNERKIHQLPLIDIIGRSVRHNIDPPYLHRPDRTLILHQTKPLPLKPMKAWPGYGGNVYFQPFKVDIKPIRDRLHHNRSPVPQSRSAASSRRERLFPTSPDILSFSKYSCLQCSSPSATQSRKMLSRNLSNKETIKADLEKDNPIVKQNNHQIFQLDKDYVLGLSKYSKFTEDQLCVSGMESLGTLKVGNPLHDVQRHSTNETFSRHTLVKKVPRNFVFHPTSNAPKVENIIAARIKEKLNMTSTQLLMKHFGISESILKQFADSYYRDNRGQLKLPTQLRIKGQGVTDSHSQQNWLSNLQLPKRTSLSAQTDVKCHERISTKHFK